MSTPLVSFVVPCYNYGRYLRDCIDNILAQEGCYEFEIIAVNDGSPDDTIDILNSYTDHRLKIIDRKINRGHVFTVNEGLAAATGKYIVRIDPDDRHHPIFLSKTLPILEANPNLGLAYGNINIIDANGRVTQERADGQHDGKNHLGNEFIALLQKNFICAPTVVARRDAWMSAWPIPEGLAFNDWYFNIMLARKWDFYYCDDVLADYRVHGSNHHTMVSMDGSEERSVLWLLNKVFQEVESNPSLERAKREAQGRIYASQYRDFATKYFGFGMNAESRRCFLEALRWNPTLWTDVTVVRHLAATFLLRSVYESARDFLKRSLRVH